MEAGIFDEYASSFRLVILILVVSILICDMRSLYGILAGAVGNGNPLKLCNFASYIDTCGLVLIE